MDNFTDMFDQPLFTFCNNFSYIYNCSFLGDLVTVMMVAGNFHLHRGMKRIKRQPLFLKRRDINHNNLHLIY